MSFVKTTADTIQYEIDWSVSLKSGDTISASSWTIPTGLQAGATAFTSTTASAFIYGGSDGVSYGVDNTVTTAAGEVIKRTIKIKTVLAISLA